MIQGLLKKMIIGLLFGLSTSYIIVSLITYFNDRVVFQGSELLIQVIISAVMGVVIGAAMQIFESNRLSPTLQLVLHYIVVLLVVFGAGMVGGWFSFSEWQSIVKLVSIQLVAYAIIWCMVRVLIKKEVDEINSLIQNRKKE